MYSPIGDLVPWTHAGLLPKRHLDWFSRFCEAHGRNWHTDRQTCAEICRIYAMHAMRPSSNNNSDLFIRQIVSHQARGILLKTAFCRGRRLRESNNVTGYLPPVALYRFSSLRDRDLYFREISCNKTVARPPAA